MVGKEAIYEYDELMIGNRRSISPDFFSFGDSANETMALGIMKYAFETYLRWDPIDLRDRIDTELLKSLRLLPLLRYIRFSEELDPNTDLFYIVWKIYPWTVNYSYEERVFRVYRNVLNGKICRFPKEFFSGTEGETRAKLCFRYMLEHIMPFPSVNEMYRFFGMRKSWEALQKAKLSVMCRDLFGDPLEYLHAALPESQRNEMFYNRELFRREYNAKEKTVRATKKEEDE